MASEGDNWKNFRKAALKAHQILSDGMTITPGAPEIEVERSRLVQTYRVLFMLAAGVRGYLDIPDWKKSPRPFFQNLLRWARENPPHMRRTFAYSDLFEPAHQALLWKFRPSEESLKNALELLLDSDPSSWDPSWPGDLYPWLISPGQRKESGSYYTPSPVVNFIVENALAPLCYKGTGANRSPREPHEILAIRVLDPAIGGGRFIIAAVEYIARALAQSRGEQLGAQHRRLAAERIYGVDRDAIAVDIARVGLWMFLGGPEKPWDYLRLHFQSGDTLIGATIEEMDREPPDYENPDQLPLFKADVPKRQVAPLRVIAESGRLSPRLEAVADLWTAALLDLERARDEYPLVRLSLPHASEERWSELEGKPGFQEARRLAKEMRFFHWELRFPDAFPPASKERPGFDAVIGNPPYRRERSGGAGQPFRVAPLARRWGEGKIDVLALFIHRGLDLLKPGGKLAFITSSYWLRAEGASRLRKRLAFDESFPLYVDLADHPVFEGISGRHGILVAGRGVTHPQQCKVLRIRPDQAGRSDTLENLLTSPKDSFSVEEFPDQRELLDAAGIFNLADRAADLICRKMEERGSPLGDVARTSQGIVENPPELNDRMIAALAERNPGLVKEEGYEAGEAVFLLPPDHHLVSTLGDKERAFLRPYFRPSSIRRYWLPDQPDGYLLYLTPQNCPDIAQFPWLREHLERYRVFMEERREVKEGKISWWHLHWPREESLFEGEHILLPQMTDQPKFARATGPAYVGMSVQVISPNKEDGHYESVDFYKPASLRRPSEAVSKGAGGVVDDDQKPVFRTLRDGLRRPPQGYGKQESAITSSPSIPPSGYLLAILNSRAVEFYLTDGGRAKERGVRLDISLQALRRIPIPIPHEGKSDPKKLEKLLKMYSTWIATH